MIIRRSFDLLFELAIFALDVFIYAPFRKKSRHPERISAYFLMTEKNS
jgi:hypothetical protein